LTTANWNVDALLADVESGIFLGGKLLRSPKRNLTPKFFDIPLLPEASQGLAPSMTADLVEEQLG
jgi:hypothetical protein